MAVLYSPLQFDSVPDSINEGVTETISVFSTNISASATYYWKIVSANSPAVTGTTFNNHFSAVTGTVVVNVTNNQGNGSFTITTLADSLVNPTIPFLFDILIYSDSTRTTLVASTAPKPITLNDTSRAKTASFATIPSSVTEDNSYTVEINTTGFPDGTELLAGIYVNAKIEYRPGGSVYTVTPLTAQSGGGVSPADFGFDDLNSTWTAVPPPSSSSTLKLFYATTVFIFANKGSFVLNVSKDDVKETASLEYFTINIFDTTATRTTTKEWTTLVKSSQITIVDSTTDTTLAWSGTLSWNAGIISTDYYSTTDRGWTCSYNFNPAGQTWSLSNINIACTGPTLVTSPQKLYWAIFLETSSSLPINNVYDTIDGMHLSEFKTITAPYGTTYGSFNMTNNVGTSGCAGAFSITVKSLPTDINAWPARYFQVKILESLPSGRTLLTTVGRNSANDYYLRSLVNNNLNNNPNALGSATLSNAYWIRVDLATAKQYGDEVTLWNSTTVYPKNSIVRTPSGYSFKSYCRVDKSIDRVNTTIGGPGGWYTRAYSGTEKSFYNTLINDYGYSAPELRSFIYDKTIVGPYIYNSVTGEYTFEEGTSIDIKYSNPGVSPGTLMYTQLTAYPTGSAVSLSSFMSYNSVAEVNTYGQYTLSVKTFKNFTTQIATQGFQAPRYIKVFVDDTSKLIGSTTSTTTNKYTILRIPYFAYVDRSWISRVAVDSAVPLGQTVDIYIYAGVGFNVLSSGTIIKVNGTAISYSMNTPVPGTAYTGGIKFTVTVDASYYFSIECVFKTVTPLSTFVSSAFSYYSTQQITHGLSVFEGSTLKTFGTFQLTAIDGSGYNSTYELPASNYGIEIYKPDSTRTPIYNSNAVTWNQVDIFTVDADSSAEKTYDIIVGKEVQVQQILLNAPPVDREARAHTVTRTGKYVSVSGGNQKAQFLVLMR